MRIFARRVALIGTIAAAAGCSGNGGSVRAPLAVPTPLQAPTNAPAANVQFRIVVPAQSPASSARRPQYVSAATKSAVISVSPGSAAPVVVNCTTVCQGQIAAPIGTDTFTVKLYDAAGGAGNLLSTGSMASSVVLDQDNAISLTFNGVVASISVVLNPATATYGKAQTSSVTVNALDADGDTIIAPGVYVNSSGNPVTIALANSDTSGHTALSVTHLTQPATGITLSYDGNSYVSPTITGTAAGAHQGAGTLAVECSPAAATAALYTDGFSSAGAQSLDRYPLTASGDNVAPSASADLNIFATAYATGLALDSAGTLYANGIVQVSASPVAYQIAVDTWCADVTGSPPPRTSFVEPINADGGIALDGAANVYGTSFNSSNMSFSVYEFAAHSGGLATGVTAASTPTPTIRNFVATPPILYALYPALAVDGPGNVYTGADSVIDEYAAGSTGTNPTPLRSITSLQGTGLVTPISTAIDPAGNVYALYMNDMRTTFPGTYAIAEFAAGTTTAPERVIEGPATQIGTFLGNPAGTINAQAVAIAVDPADNLFVLNSAAQESGSQIFGEGSVEEFGKSQSGNAAPLTTVNLAGSAVVPNDLAVDGSDNLYVSDAGSFVAGGSLYEYNISGTHLRTLAGNAPDGSSSYESVAVDSTGNVAVTDYDGVASGNVYFFGTSQTGNSAPNREIAVANVLFVKQLGFDSSADLFVLTAENQFNTVFVSPFQTDIASAKLRAVVREPLATLQPVRARPIAIPTLEASARNVRARKKPQFAFPPSEGGPTPPFEMVSVYGPSASGSATPLRSFTDTFTFDSEGDGMAVSGTGVAYVSSRFGNAIYVYAPAASGTNVSPTLAYWTFAPSTAFPHVQTDAAGNLYNVSGISNAIAVYAPGATTPERTIFGPHTLISSPSQPMIDASGDIFILDFDLNAILVFGPGQSGDVPPLRVLSQSDVTSRDVNQFAIGPGTVSGSVTKVRRP
jgi:hypothetical protein